MCKPYADTTVENAKHVRTLEHDSAIKTRSYGMWLLALQVSLLMLAHGNVTVSLRRNH